jgi:hypothetical protein
MSRAQSCILGLPASFSSLLLGGIVLQQFVDEVHVCHEHTSATVARAPKLRHCVSIRYALLEIGDVLLVQVCDNLRSRQYAGFTSRAKRRLTLPQEKQRIGMIILSLSRRR